MNGVNNKFLLDFIAGHNDRKKEIGRINKPSEQPKDINKDYLVNKKKEMTEKENIKGSVKYIIENKPSKIEVAEFLQEKSNRLNKNN